MAEAASFQKSETRPIPIDERVLSEVDHLSEHRRPDGSYSNEVLDDILVNLKTALQEASMPNAVSTTVHNYERISGREGVFRWMGKTAVENALSGYKFHEDEAARARVAVEVDEAKHSEEDLRPGVMKVFVSPRMSEYDADKVTAERENLAHEDAVRVSWLETDKEGNIKSRTVQSLLVKEVPLEAWVAMMEDPNNVFGKSIKVQNPESALSVMEAHRQMELPQDKLQDGPVSIVKEVSKYIQDPIARQKVLQQIELYNVDQSELDTKAQIIAERWMKFEVELAESVSAGHSTYEVERFISSLQHNWSEEDLRVIDNHSFGSGYIMTRDLAILLENAKRNVLWISGAAASDNQEFLLQINPDIAAQIKRDELLIQEAWRLGQDLRMIEIQNHRRIAQQNISIGGGCAGQNEAKFKKVKGLETDVLDVSTSIEKIEEDEEEWKVGICRIEACSSRPGTTMVGPCRICKVCEKAFDRGEDPNSGNSEIGGVIGFLLFEASESEADKKELVSA